MFQPGSLPKLQLEQVCATLYRRKETGMAHLFTGRQQVREFEGLAILGTPGNKMDQPTLAPVRTGECSK